MSSRNKRVGTEWEIAIEQFLNGEGERSRRLPRAGSKDIGDVSWLIKPGLDLVIEAKNVQSAWSQMAEFLRQSDIEAVNYEDKYGGTAVGAVVTKTRQKGTDQGRVVFTLESFLEFVRLMRA